jgi:hypothetical protein
MVLILSIRYRNYLFQIQTLDSVPTETLREKWQGICLNENALSEILKVGGFTENVPWMKFIAVAAGHLTNVSLTKLQQASYCR